MSGVCDGTRRCRDGEAGRAVFIPAVAADRFVPVISSPMPIQEHRISGDDELLVPCRSRTAQRFLEGLRRVHE